MSIEGTKEVLAWVALIAAAPTLVGALWCTGVRRNPYEHPAALVTFLGGGIVICVAALGIVVFRVIQVA